MSEGVVWLSETEDSLGECVADASAEGTAVLHSERHSAVRAPPAAWKASGGSRPGGAPIDRTELLQDEPSVCKPRGAWIKRIPSLEISRPSRAARMHAIDNNCDLVWQTLTSGVVANSSVQPFTMRSWLVTHEGLAVFIATTI